MAYTTIDNPFKHFNTKIYTGNGSTQSITGVGFQPDWVWIKNRGAVTNHEVADSVRGVNKLLKPNDTDAEQSNSNKITSFDSNGFAVGNDANVNQNSTAIVSWNWLAANGTASNSDGSITSTVSANTTAGFSIVSYTGTGSAGTLGHGLSAVPKMIILKERVGTENWMVYHAGNTSAPETDYLLLNTTSATADYPVWNDTAPTSSVFSIGSDSSTSTSGDTYIAYCFAEKKGYSKFGSYTGNGNADGTFVYTGFKPAWVMRKYTTGGSASGEGWEMLDSARSLFNVADKRLKADSSGAESTGSNYYVDFLSNGFKCRTVDNATNNSGATYIYMAFAEAPFVTAGTKAAGTAK